MKSMKRLFAVITAIGMIATLFAGLTISANAEGEITGTVISADKTWIFGEGEWADDVISASDKFDMSGSYTKFKGNMEYDGLTVSGDTEIRPDNKTYPNSHVFIERTAVNMLRVGTNSASFNVSGPCIIAVDFATTNNDSIRGFVPKANGVNIAPVDFNSYGKNIVDDAMGKIQYASAIFAYIGTEPAKIDLVPFGGVSFSSIMADFPEYDAVNSEFAALMDTAHTVTAVDENGTYTVSKTEAKYGETVRVGVSANNGFVYAKDSLDVTYQNAFGEEISVNLTEVTSESGETQAFEFIMPAENVNVTSTIAAAVFNDIVVDSNLMGGKIVFTCDDDPNAVEKVDDNHYRAIAGKVLTVSFAASDEPAFAGYIYKVGTLNVSAADGSLIAVMGEYDADKITFVMPGATVNASAEFCVGNIQGNSKRWIFEDYLSQGVSNTLTLEGGLKLYANESLTYGLQASSSSVNDSHDILTDSDGNPTGETFYQSVNNYLRLQGTGRFDENGNPVAGVLEFTPTKPCRISAVIVSSNSQGELRQLNVAQGGKLIGQIGTGGDNYTDLGDDENAVTTNIVNEPVYIYSEYSHIRFYALKVEYLDDVEPAAMTSVDGQFTQANTPIKRFIYFTPETGSTDSRPGTQSIVLNAWSQDKTTSITGRLIVIQRDNDGNIVDLHISEEKTGVKISEEVNIKLATEQEPAGLPCDIENGEWSSTKYDIEGYIWDGFDNIKPLTENQSVFKYNTDDLYVSAE